MLAWTHDVIGGDAYIMPWIPLAERFSTLPLILSGPILRRAEPGAVTVWLALKEARTVTLRIYGKDAKGKLIQRLVGTHCTVRLGDYLHVVAVTARATDGDQRLEWGALYYYDLFFQSDDVVEKHVPSTAAHLDTPGILTLDPSAADLRHRLVYPGHPLPSFVLPPEDLNQLRIMHGSCRKPHGVGKEMLAALDAILERVHQDTAQRPQQLFLTGDQIYGDDVAAPLLFALIDAGEILFRGNKEEVLPLVNVPACTFPPGGRASVVRNKAMLTTTTPKNHLLSLAEYVAMYLFAWSDVLWPDDLPEIEDIRKTYNLIPADDMPYESEEQYTDMLEKLGQFRSTLPHVRRVLANIALYTICDDHDVTDDWYLDGAWCQQVLKSKLGHQVIRNALLAYALFQAWGNTPDQFDQPYGKAFLDAVDAWRGDEADWRIDTISTLLNLPTSFAGSGELPHAEQALKWHYTYAGPSYQIIVMDTRTYRLYRSPSAFPCLLSPQGLETQVTAAIREDVEVTIMISATPVIGQNFVEAIQFWSHWSLRNNYGMDREAWALDWDTFHHFLKIVSAMKRVVFLSGDVHYAFGSSLEYWSYAEKATAKMVDYTSSPLLNEVSGPEIAVLATIYPQLSRLLGGQDTSQADFFAWDTDIVNRHLLKKIVHIILMRIYIIWWSVPKLIDTLRSHSEIVLPAEGWPKGAFSAFPPDRSYRVRYLRDGLDIVDAQGARGEKPQSFGRELPRWLLKLIRVALKGVTILQTRLGKARKGIARRTIGVVQAPNSHVRKHSAHAVIKGADLLERKLEKPKNRLGETMFRHQEWLQEWKAGTHIIGYANIGEILFHWNEEEQEVIQRLWWWHPLNPEQPALATEFCETLKPPAFDEGPPLP
jgi:hypothetical protein